MITRNACERGIRYTNNIEAEMSPNYFQDLSKYSSVIEMVSYVCDEHELGRVRFQKIGEMEIILGKRIDELIPFDFNFDYVMEHYEDRRFLEKFIPFSRLDAKKGQVFFYRIDE